VIAFIECSEFVAMEVPVVMQVIMFDSESVAVISHCVST
jgi:hypothetical protein